MNTRLIESLQTDYNFYNTNVLRNVDIVGYSDFTEMLRLMSRNTKYNSISTMYTELSRFRTYLLQLTNNEIVCIHAIIDYKHIHNICFLMGSLYKSYTDKFITIFDNQPNYCIDFLQSYEYENGDNYILKDSSIIGKLSNFIDFIISNVKTELDPSVEPILLLEENEMEMYGFESKLKLKMYINTEYIRLLSFYFRDKTMFRDNQYMEYLFIDYIRFREKENNDTLPHFNYINIDTLQFISNYIKNNFEFDNEEYYNVKYSLEQHGITSVYYDDSLHGELPIHE